MNDNEFSKVGLYEHNARSYRKIKEAYELGEKIVGIVHATGTGKSYNALQLAYDNPDKKIIYVVPNNSIAEHIESIIRDNPNLDRERDFPNLEFRTYHSFINYSYEELEELDCDLLILDEFHHLGAPVWGSRIKAIIETHPEMLVFGMTAYTVRDRGTAYERDMANPDGGELFSNKIVSRYDLVDAMLDGVLPRDIIYRTSYTNLLGLEQALENKINNMKATKEELEQYKKILETIKKRVAEAPGITEVVRKYVKPNGKYFYFCPPRSEEGTNDINTIMKEAYEWFKTYVPEEDIVFYSTTSEMKDEGKHNREMFYNDKTLDGQDASNKLRVMFAINQYNEGVHAPNVDGVIMGRGTTSDIVYFEQLGRALSVGGNTKEIYAEYDKYTYEELLEIAKNKEISIPDNIKREELIDKIIAPVIIDLTNNIEFIKELEDNIKDRVRERREKSTITKNTSKLMNVSFDIDVVNEDLYQVLSSLKNRVNNDWDSMYELAKNYYEHYGNLDISNSFRTFNGIDYDKDGFNLGTWLVTQKQNYKNEKLSEERKEKLQLLEIKLEFRKEKWNEMYELAKNYYKHYGNSDIPALFKTKNGIDYSEDGINLGIWVNTQRINYKNKMLNEERKEKLLEIEFKFEQNKEKWDEWYNLAKIYYEYYGNLYIPTSFKTKNGIDYDEDGVNLGIWIYNQSAKFKKNKVDEERKDKLLLIDIESITYDSKWENWYNLAKKYYEHYGNLEIPTRFKTKNGIDYDEDGIKLGIWLKSQQRFYKKGKLKEERRLKLEKIGFIEKTAISINDAKWDNMYELAKKYYEYHHNLEIPDRFSTINGFEHQDDGIKLGIWLHNQRKRYKSGKLESDKMAKLDLLEINIDIHDKEWNDMYQLAKAFYLKNGHLNIPVKLKTLNGIDYSEDGFNLGNWYSKQKQLIKKGKISEDRINKLREIGLNEELLKGYAKEMLSNDFDYMYNLLEIYYNHYKNLNIPNNFKTINGIDYDEDGINLYEWFKQQMELFKKNKLSKTNREKFMQDWIKLELENEILSDYVLHNWNAMYHLLQKYYEHHRNVDVPLEFRTFNGYEENPKGYELGFWVNYQKIKEKNIGDNRYAKLKELNMIFSKEDSIWEKSYNLATKYFEHHQDLDISTDFRTLDGINYSTDEEAINLYDWKLEQIEALKYNQYNKYRIEKLENIGIAFNKQEEYNFDKIYQIAKEFYDTYGHVDVRFKYLHNPNKKETIDEYILDFWVLMCKDRYRKGKLDEETIKKLNEIGMFLSAHEVKWNHMYKLACNYLEHWGNLYVPLNFNTENGYDYADKGYELGKWIAYQRNKYSSGKLDEDRIDKLNSINMVWDIRNNKQDNIKVCLEYGIDYKRFGKTLSHISNIELVAKINYLLSIGENIVYTHNYGAHEIFTMSSIDMKNKYGYTLEELINEYYIVDKKNRGI